MTIEYRAPVTVLLAAAAAAIVGDFCPVGALKRTFQATITGSNQAVLSIQGSNDGVGWVPIVDMAPDGSDPLTASVGYVTDSPWWLVRANLASITGGAVTVTMGTSKGN